MSRRLLLNSQRMNLIEKFAEDPRKDQTEEFRANIRHLVEMIVWGEKENQGFFEYVFTKRDLMQNLYNILVRTTTPSITSKVLEALILIINNFEKPYQIGWLAYLTQRESTLRTRSTISWYSTTTS